MAWRSQTLVFQLETLCFVAAMLSPRVLIYETGERVKTRCAWHKLVQQFAIVCNFLIVYANASHLKYTMPSFFASTSHHGVAKVLK